MEDQTNKDANGQAQSRRGGSVMGGDRGDNVISINGVDMNIDEYLAFSLAAAQAAQEDAMGQDHAHSDLMQGEGMEDGQGQNQTGFEHYDENGHRDDTPIADVHSFGLGATGASDDPIPIDPSLQQYPHAHLSAPEVIRRDPNSIHLPINVDDDDAELGTLTEQPASLDTQPPVAPDEPKEDDPPETLKDTTEAIVETDANPATTETTAEMDSMSVDFDDDEDDGDFVPENELPGDDAMDADETAPTSPADEPAQTQDSTMVEATQGVQDTLEDDDDDDDDELFLIEEADFEDLLQPIEDVPIPVEDYLEIQAQYQRHLEEFNATLLRQQVAEMIANEDAGAAAPHETAEQQQERERAYQDTLESLGIAPEASQAQG